MMKDRISEGTGIEIYSVQEVDVSDKSLVELAAWLAPEKWIRSEDVEDALTLDDDHGPGDSAQEFADLGRRVIRAFIAAGGIFEILDGTIEVRGTVREIAVRIPGDGSELHTYIELVKRWRIAASALHIINDVVPDAPPDSGDEIRRQG